MITFTGPRSTVQTRTGRQRVGRTPNMLHWGAQPRGLGINVLDSRKSHAFTLLGNLTGMKVVKETSYHVRMLQGRISPALPELFSPMAARISASMKGNFPQTFNWAAMRPLPATVRCFSQGIALVLYGTKMSANPRLIELTYELTEDSKSP